MEGSSRKRSKNKLPKAKKEYYYNLLMQARGMFMRQINSHASGALVAKDSPGERAGLATHMADLGSDCSRNDLDLGLMSSEVDVVNMIEEALQRISKDEYGVCLSCGQLIPEARLAAKPYARYCTACKSKMEELEDPAKRSR